MIELAHQGRGRRRKGAGVQTHKRCARCKEVKERSEFRLRRKDKPTLQANCIPCSNAAVCERAKAKREEHNAYTRLWRTENRDRVRQRRYEQYWSNPDASREYHREKSKNYAPKARETRKAYLSKPGVRDRINASYRYRRRHIPNVALAHRLRSRLRDALKGGSKKGSSVLLLGISLNAFRFWIDQFFEPGMSWDNMHLWHLDHKRPLSSFDLSCPSQLAQACHFTNIQPMWARDNQAKGNRWLQCA